MDPQNLPYAPSAGRQPRVATPAERRHYTRQATQLVPPPPGRTLRLTLFITACTLTALSMFLCPLLIVALPVGILAATLQGRAQPTEKAWKQQHAATLADLLNRNGLV